MEETTGIGSKATPLSTLIYLAVSAILITAFLIRLFIAFGYMSEPYFEGWSFSEFLITYQGGFVRRGIPGEILFHLSSWSGIGLAWWVVGLCLLAFLFVIGFFFRKFIERKLLWWLILTPFLCGYVEDIIRKDFICYAFLIAIMYLTSRFPLNSARVTVATVIGVLGLLIHEAFIFFGLPIVALVTLREWKSKFNWVPSAIFITVFLILCAYNGNKETVSGILNAWDENFELFNFNYDNAPERMNESAIGALTWETAETVRFHISKNFDSPTIGYWAILIRLLYFYLSWILIVNFFMITGFYNVSTSPQRIHGISLLYVFSSLCLLPLFTVLSCDYSRIYQYAFVATLSAWLLYPSETEERIFGKKLSSWMKAFDNRFILLPRHLVTPVTIILLLLLAESPYFFNPEMAFFYSPLGTIIESVASFT